jgi:hypothetical protein
VACGLGHLRGIRARDLHRDRLGLAGMITPPQTLDGVTQPRV